MKIYLWLTLIETIWAACPASDYQTLFGRDDVRSYVFSAAVSTVSQDLVAGGMARGEGYLYYQRWDKCEVSFAVDYPGFTSGIAAVSFDYTQQQVYALGLSNESQGFQWLVHFTSPRSYNVDWPERVLKITTNPSGTMKIGGLLPYYGYSNRMLILTDVEIKTLQTQDYHWVNSVFTYKYEYSNLAAVSGEKGLYVLQSWRINSGGITPTYNYLPHVQRLDHQDLTTAAFTWKIAGKSSLFIKDLKGQLDVYYDASTYPLYEYIHTCVHEDDQNMKFFDFVEIHWLWFISESLHDKKQYRSSAWEECYGMHATSATTALMLVRSESKDIRLYEIDFDTDLYTRHESNSKLTFYDTSKPGYEQLDAQFLKVSSSYSHFYLFGVANGSEGGAATSQTIGFVLSSDDSMRTNAFFKSTTQLGSFNSRSSHQMSISSATPNALELTRSGAWIETSGGDHEGAPSRLRYSHDQIKGQTTCALAQQVRLNYQPSWSAYPTIAAAVLEVGESLYFEMDAIEDQDGDEVFVTLTPDDPACTLNIWHSLGPSYTDPSKYQSRFASHITNREQIGTWYYTVTAVDSAGNEMTQPVSFAVVVAEAADVPEWEELVAAGEIIYQENQAPELREEGSLGDKNTITEGALLDALSEAQDEYQESKETGDQSSQPPSIDDKEGKKDGPGDPEGKGGPLSEKGGPQGLDGKGGLEGQKSGPGDKGGAQGGKNDPKRGPGKGKDQGQGKGPLNSGEDRNDIQQFEAATTAGPSAETLAFLTEKITQLTHREPTVDEAKRAYGGEVKKTAPKISNLGEFAINFSRQIHYPRSIIPSEFKASIPDIAPPEIEIILSEEEKKELNQLEQDLKSMNEVVNSDQGQQQSLQKQSAKGNGKGQGEGIPKGRGGQGGQSKKPAPPPKRRLQESSWSADPDIQRDLISRIRVEVYNSETPEFDSETKLKGDRLAHSWNLTSITPVSIDVQVNFTNAELVSSAGYQDNMRVYLDFADFEPDWDSDSPVLDKALPTQVPLTTSAKAVQVTTETVGQASTVAAVGAFASSVVLQGALAQLWGMINGLQVFVHLPLIRNVEFPAYPQMLINSMITIATFDLIPTDNLFAWIWDIPEEEEEYIKQEYVDTGYESNYAIINLGMIFLLVMYFVFLLFMLAIGYPCRRRFKWVGKHHTKTKQTLFWNGCLTFMLESNLELVLVAQIVIRHQIDMQEHGWHIPSDGRVFYFFDILVVIVFGLLSTVMPVWLLIFYLKNFDKWETEEFENKWGAPLEALRKDEKSSIIYPFQFMLRRYLFTFFLAIYPDFLWLHLFIQFMATIWAIIYILWSQPFEETLVQNLEIMNECTSLLLLYCVMTFTNWTDPTDHEQRALLGWVFCSIMGGNIAVHLFFLLKSTYYDVKEACSKKCLKKHQETATEDKYKDKSFEGVKPPDKKLEEIKEEDSSDDEDSLEVQRQKSNKTKKDRIREEIELQHNLEQAAEMARIMALAADVSETQDESQFVAFKPKAPSYQTSKKVAPPIPDILVDFSDDDISDRVRVQEQSDTKNRLLHELPSAATFSINESKLSTSNNSSLKNVNTAVVQKPISLKPTSELRIEPEDSVISEKVRESYYSESSEGTERPVYAESSQY